MSNPINTILTDLILAENLIAGIADAIDKPPGHAEFLAKQQMGHNAKRALPAIEAAIEKLKGVSENETPTT